MFDIAGSELVLLIILALIFIAPKDLPKMMRAIGAFIRKARMIAREFQTSLEDLANENDIADLKKEAMDIKKQAEDIKNEASDAIKTPSDKVKSPLDGQKRPPEGGKKPKGTPKKAGKGGK